LLVGFERAGKNIDDLAAGVDLLLALRRQAAAKFIIEAGIAEIALLVSYPFLQTAVRLDGEFRHDASPNSATIGGGGPDSARGCHEASRSAFRTSLARRPSTTAIARVMENSRARAS